MSDTALNKFFQYGTAAQRGSFTPAPASGVQVIYIWYETDTGNTYLYDTSWHQITAATPGKIVQVVNTETGAVATGTTTVPLDDTIPQNTEGNEYMTLAITPNSSSNKLRIDVTVILSHSANSANVIASLFQDTTANALASALSFALTATGMTTISFTHYMTAGTVSATTFKVRAGSNQTGTTTFNGASGNRFLGGVMASSITISEIVP